MSAALGLLTGVAIALTACGGSSLPALTDPNEIITAALKSTESAKSVHIDLTLDGSINADLSGTGAPAVSLPLTGTTASADVDMAAGKARATFAVPAFLNLNGELIQIGETSYVKTSLTGPLYEAQQAADSLPVDPTDAAGIFDDVGDFFLADGVDPAKGDDVDCGGKQCYTVMIELTPDELAALGAGQAAGDLPIDVGAASLALTIRVEKDTYHLAGIKAVASLGDQGSLTFDLTLSKWDQPMDISPPPTD
ncbi:MAG: LppX_LprAFG lipoprotein [Candidatus Limnocylindrales bacterium]|nr:LppX_LprAFG lipoprotein [Candidatus Limnocylindrales bacterium]